jgi:REP element-mobilizing transposase RayT
MLGQEARTLGCAWAVVGGIEDPIHLLCSIPATLEIATLVHQVKGASARCATKHGQTLKWQVGYGAFSVSPDAVDVVEAYVRNQAEHHHGNAALPGWE